MDTFTDITLLVIAAWLWVCCAVISVWMDEEVDGIKFNWHSASDWWNALLAPIHVSSVFVGGFLEALRGDK